MHPTQHSHNRQSPGRSPKRAIAEQTAGVLIGDRRQQVSARCGAWQRGPGQLASPHPAGDRASTVGRLPFIRPVPDMPIAAQLSPKRQRSTGRPARNAHNGR